MLSFFLEFLVGQRVFCLSICALSQVDNKKNFSFVPASIAIIQLIHTYFKSISVVF